MSIPNIVRVCNLDIGDVIVRQNATLRVMKRIHGLFVLVWADPRTIKGSSGPSQYISCLSLEYVTYVCRKYNGMKIQAYQCDYCGDVKDGEAITGLGVIVIQPDLFEPKPIIRYRYKPNLDPANCEVHFCMSCFDRLVTSVIKVNRATHEAEYADQYKLYSQSFYELVHNKAVVNRNKVTGRH